MIRIVPIKFRDAGKRYDFNAHGLELKRNDYVIVETDRGRALGQVVAPPREVKRGDAPKDVKSVLRPANDEDLNMAQSNARREQDAFTYCQRRIAERKMEMKLVRAEFLFDGSKILFYFTADGRIDFRELVKDLAHHFHTRIEMRQIGVRDEAKLTGGIGICGRELCCCTFLTDFTPVSVRMAKEQGLALNPTKISGQCGRLLCCLSYEFQTYCSMKKGLPKCGKKVQVDQLTGEVIEQNVLARKIKVRTSDGEIREFTAEDIAAGKVLPAHKQEPAPSGRKEGAEEKKRPARRPRPQQDAGKQRAKEVDKGQPKEPAKGKTAAEEKAEPPTARQGKKRRGRRRQRRKGPEETK